MPRGDAIASPFCGIRRRQRGIGRDLQRADCGVEIGEHGGGAVHGVSAGDVYFCFGGGRGIARRVLRGGARGCARFGFLAEIGY